MVSESAAKELHESFAKTIISKLPELEWKLSGPKDVMERYATELVMLSMGRIK